jgi:ABC-type dipeptide/oligopeptide/nickel transport system permease component
MLGGSAIVEILFARPGLGWLLLTAITSRDYNVMQACIFVFAVIFVVLNLIVDILYCYIDPRIRVS